MTALPKIPDPGFDGSELSYRLRSLYEWCSDGLSVIDDLEAEPAAVPSVEARFQVLRPQLALPSPPLPDAGGEAVATVADPSEVEFLEPQPPIATPAAAADAHVESNDQMSVVLTWPKIDHGAAVKDMAFVPFGWAATMAPDQSSTDQAPAPSPRTRPRWLPMGRLSRKPSWE